MLFLSGATLTSKVWRYLERRRRRWSHWQPLRPNCCLPQQSGLSGNNVWKREVLYTPQNWTRLSSSEFKVVVQILPLQHEGNQQQPLLCCYFSPHPVHVGTWTYQFNHWSNLSLHLICLKTGFSFQIKSAHKPMCLETFMGQQAHVKGQVATVQPWKCLNWSPR